MKISNTVQWVGKIDWDLRKFHGSEYSTFYGSTYNSYLVRDEKTALIDTVWAPYAREYVRHLSSLIDLESIDYVIAPHAEIDHSGGLPELMRHIPDKPVFCSPRGVDSLRGHFHQDWNFQPVKTGDRLSLGSRELIFVEAPMLHWPDNMFCYLTEEAILFSNDAFGQHLASEQLYNDLVDQDLLFRECMKYYANILNPFSVQVEKKIKELLAMQLPISIICPSHGVIWREKPLQIVDRYREWAGAYREDQVSIVYDTMWEGTRRMAESIAAGIHEAAPLTEIKLLNSSKTDKNEIITEIFRSGTVLFGSPTINRGILTSMAGLLEEVRGLKFRGKKAAAFGCYGWSGEGVGILSDALRDAGFELVSEGLRVLWNPDRESLEECVQYGRKLAADI
ncbi:MAG: anaerobic nitric oxide reductase flavorubredoxin [Desulfobulbaceae bacterium]|nr:anaerobic nitric oxide reductase flavorubredoxin [Desulfobulbaceae bacterium]